MWINSLSPAFVALPLCQPCSRGWEEGRPWERGCPFATSTDSFAQCPYFGLVFRSLISLNNTPDKREWAHIYMHTNNAMQDILRTWLSSSSSTSDIIKCRCHHHWLHYIISYTRYIHCLQISFWCKWPEMASAFKNIRWAGRVIIQSPPWFKGDISFWLESDDCFQKSVFCC